MSIPGLVVSNYLSLFLCLTSCFPYFVTPLLIKTVLFKSVEGSHACQSLQTELKLRKREYRRSRSFFSSRKSITRELRDTASSSSFNILRQRQESAGRRSILNHEGFDTLTEGEEDPLVFYAKRIKRTSIRSYSEDAELERLKAAAAASEACIPSMKDVWYS